MAPGSIYSCSGLAQEAGAYNVSLVQRWVGAMQLGTKGGKEQRTTGQRKLIYITIFSCKTDNCNTKPTAFGPEPSTTKKPVNPTPAPPPPAPQFPAPASPAPAQPVQSEPAGGQLDSGQKAGATSWASASVLVLAGAFLLGLH